MGEVVFGVDDTTMEAAVAALLVERGVTLGLAESLTGGLVASRLVGVPGASDWFRGSVVSYASEVKYDVLGVPERAGGERGGGARHGRGSAARSSAPTSASPSPGWRAPTSRRAWRPGPSSWACAVGEREAESLELHLPGDRERVRQYAAISALDLLRRRLLAEVPARG